MTPYHHKDERGDDELHKTPEPVHEDFRYMIRSTYQTTKELKNSVATLVEARHKDDLRLDRLEQSRKAHAFWMRTLAGTILTTLVGGLWAFLTSSHFKPPSSHP